MRTFQLRYLFAAVAGAFFALAVWKIMGMEWRYAMVVAVAMLFVSVAMMGISRLTDLIILAFVFNIPFSMFGKWFFRLADPVRGVAAQGISLGMVELLIIIAYAIWFGRIFITRKEPLPKLGKIDFFIFLLLIVEVISLLGAYEKKLAFFEIIYNIKHGLMYFFIAHNAKRYHLKWIVLLLLCAVFFESSLAVYERVTGNVGIGLAKGDIQNTDFGTQPGVRGIFEEIRASGTTNDSHALGLYFAMLLPVPFVLMMIPKIKAHYRVLLASILVMGAIGLIITFARSGWLSFAIAVTFAMGVIVFIWKQKKIIFLALAVFIITSALYPKAYSYLYDRLFDAPSELLEDRYSLNHTAMSVWSQHPLFGAGPANYHNAMWEPNVRIFDGYTGYPVHNAYLIVASETGLFGLITFYGIIFFAMRACWKAVDCEDYLIRAMALAVLTGLFAYLLDGITGPMFKEAVPYAQLWVYMGLSLSFRRLLYEETDSLSRSVV